jgi:hypothetical protein
VSNEFDISFITLREAHVLPTSPLQHPIMSFGIGAGDILVVSKLAYDLYRAFSSRNDTPTEIQKLSSELWNLNSVLDQLAALAAIPGSRFQSPEIVEVTMKLLESSRASFHNSWKLLSKYDSVEKGKRRGLNWAKRLLGNVRKVQWRYEKDELVCLRVEIGSQLQGFTLLLNVVNGWAVLSPTPNIYSDCLVGVPFKIWMADLLWFIRFYPYVETPGLV